MVKMTVTGGKEIAAKLRQLSFAEQRGALSKMLMKAAGPIEGRMAQLAPIEPGAPDLKDSILTQPVRKITDLDDGEVRKLDDTEAAVVIGPSKTAFYGFFQEYGTAPHGAHPGHAAQPFARPAFDEQHRAALDSIQRDIGAYLREHGGT